MRRPWTKLIHDERGSVAPTVALSLVALLATGGLAFDYAQMEGMQSELIQAADQAALAGASQLDGQTGACARAAAAARSLITNNSRFANDGAGPGITIANEPSCDATGYVQFYQSWDQSTDTPGPASNADANAKVVLVTVGGRTAKFAMTPIVGMFNSGSIKASAVASVGRAICKTPPVMICNPDEPSTNTDEMLAFNGTRGMGLSLVTGNATVPGNFGWLVAGNGPGAGALAGELGYNQPIGDCQNYDGVTTKTGMDTSVLNAFNTRFDVFANGNTTCPSNPGGICSPSINTRKDLVCNPNNSNSACNSSNNSTWGTPAKPYKLPQTCTGSGKNQVCTTTIGALPVDGSKDPTIMGYPHDMVQADLMSNWAAAYAIKGDGNWDRDAYFRVNYGWNNATWTAKPGLSASSTRFDVYQWELANTNVGGKGIAVPQINGNEGAFGQPATGQAGIAQSSSQPDRREMAVAVLNCQALSAHGKFTAQPVSWLDVFLTEPAIKRGSGNALYTSDKGIYVEIVGVTKASTSDPSAIVIRRDKPYLIK
jgi:Flp pilus assembly protein TadG